MNHKAQGTIEYLVIIAIVVVIALVVVGLLLQILGNFGSMSETSLKTAWKSAEPWAITDWSKTGSVVSLVLKNNTAETLQFNSITLQGTDKNSTARPNIPSGATITITGTASTIACTTGSKYSYPKAGISIDYNTSTISNKIQYGVADIAGTC
jgi:hypothetical protein